MLFPNKFKEQIG